MRENIPYNANIVPSSWGHLYMRPLDQNRETRPIRPRPPCGYVHDILAAVWGSWYFIHNLYQLPLNG